MPELARFYGIIIRMFMEPATEHYRPHFHAYYQDFVAVFAIDTIEILAVHLPRKQLRLAFAWAELHYDELITDWNLLRTDNYLSR